MTDQQAYEMGRRWVAAGFVPSPTDAGGLVPSFTNGGAPVRAVYADHPRYRFIALADCLACQGTGDVTEWTDVPGAGYSIDCPYCEERIASRKPDPRDPGNKGHAVAQLRERLNDPGAYVAHDFVDGNEFVEEGWTFVRTSMNSSDVVGHPTEEECLTAALEATKP